MKLTCEDYDQLAVVAIRGDLSGEQVDALRKTATDRLGQQTRDFVLDITGVDTVDSKGLETLLWLQERCGEKLGQIRLAAPNETVRKILELTRLAARFDIHDDVDSAIKSLR
jgi:anti-anti-sigma factor